MLLVRGYEADLSSVAKHLRWPEGKIQAAVNYAKAFPEEIEEAISENDSVNFETLRRMVPQTVEFVSQKAKKS
jgi:hypothetical protein